jgi:hypothetical protein
MRKYFFAMLAAVALILTAPHVQAQELKNPEKIGYVLKLLTHISNDHMRQVDSKTFDRIAHESEEFHEAAAAFEKEMAGEDAALNTKVTAALKEAVAASRAMVAKSSANDETVLRAAHGELAKKVSALDALFPAAMRPQAGFMFKPGERAKAAPK